MTLPNCDFMRNPHVATTQPCFCNDFEHVSYNNVLHVYILWGVKMWHREISFAKSDQCQSAWSVFPEMWFEIGFQATYECCSKLICKNHISSDFLLFILTKYMFRFQLDMHKNLELDSLNKALKAECSNWPFRIIQ